MKIQMIGTEWKEIGVLSGIASFSLNKKLGSGTVFESKAGVKIFFSKEDLDILTSAGGSSTTSRKLF